MYFMARGECNVFVIDENKSQKFIHSLKVGNYFGEVALLKECCRTATIISNNYTTCAALEREKFMKLLYRFPFIRRSLEKRIKNNYQDRWRKFVKRSLRNVDYLGIEVSEDIVEEISFQCEPISIHEGEVLFLSGKP